MSNLVIVFQTETDGEVYLHTIKTRGLTGKQLAQKVEQFVERHRLGDEYALIRGDVVKSFNMQNPLRSK